MEKVIVIDGKNVRLKSTGSTTMRYKAQFASDFLKDILKLNPLISLVGDDGEVDISKIDDGVLDKIDFELFNRLIWVFAKTADPQNVQDPMTWLDQFEEFPIVDILPEIIDLLTACLSKKKI